MIGRVAMLGDYAEKPRMRAFEHACHRAGFTVERVPKASLARPADFDFAFTSGRRKPEREAFARFTREGKAIVVLDLGYLKRASSTDPRGYHQVGLNRIGWIPEIAPSADRFELLKIEVLSRRKRQGPLLILGQCPGDSQHPFDTSRRLQWWLRCQLRGIELNFPPFPDRIIYRPHPLSKTDCRMVGLSDDWEWQDPNGVSIEEAVEEAQAILTYNSTAAIEGIRQGVPVICAPEAHYHPVSSAPHAERLRYFQRLAYAQWTLDEITRGDALNYLLRTQFEMP